MFTNLLKNNKSNHSSSSSTFIFMNMPSFLFMNMASFFFIIAISFLFTIIASFSFVQVVSSAAVNSPVSFSEKELKLSTGKKIVRVILVDQKSTDVSFEVNTPSSQLNKVQSFEDQVRLKKPYAAINANFFTSYAEIKDPVGHVQANGEIIYGQSGITSIGITRSKDIIFSIPGIFTRIFVDGLKTNKMRPDGTAYYNNWSAYEINTRSQSITNSIMYTPARGSKIGITASGSILTVRSDEIESFTRVEPGDICKIPADGYLVFFGNKITNSWKGDNGLKPGRKVEKEYYLFNNTNPSFKLEEMQWILSGGPDLVTGGKSAPKSKHPAFTGSRFTSLSTLRTAVGTDRSGKMVIVSAKAKIDELKEIMLKLGCVNAINLDGGDSAAMYYNGKFLVKPGRKLATLLYIYYKPDAL